MSQTMHRFAAWLFAAIVALVVAPSMAFAADDAAPWTEWADNDTVFTVATQTADGQIQTVGFTKAQMVEMAKQNTQDAAYVFSSKKGVTVVVADEYVTIDQLISAANTTFKEGDKLVVSSGDWVPSSKPTYAEFMASKKFYPAFAVGDYNAEGAYEVPSIVALKWGDVKLEEGTAGAALEDAKAESHHEGLRNFWGKTAEEFSADGNMGGNSYASNADMLTIFKPFNVYEQNSGTKTLVKSYYQDDMAALATTAETADDARAFLFNKNGWQVCATSKFVPVQAILADAFGADFALKEGQSVVASAADNFSTYMSYEQLNGKRYFYPATSSSAVSDEGAAEVGTVLALTWGSGAVEQAAGATKNEILDDVNADKIVTQYRVFTGLASTDDPSTGGNRFATGPVELTVMTPKDVADSSIEISGIEAAYAYTGEAIEPTVVVKDGDKTLEEFVKKSGDYTVEYVNNVEMGTGSVIIKGVNSYTGTKTLTFEITKDGKPTPAPVELKAQTITAKNVTKTFGAKAFSLGAKTNGDGKLTYASSNKKVATVSSAGKVTVKGAGTAKITIKAAATSTYKAATKTVTVKVNKAKNPVTLAKKTINAKASQLKKKAKTYSINKAKKAQGKVTYSIASAKKGTKSFKSKFSINKSTGKLTVKKGTAKGTYRVTVKATAKGNANYKSGYKTATVTVKVK